MALPRCDTWPHAVKTPIRIAGNITQIASELGQTQYTYDSLNRLTQASPDAALKNLGLPQEQYSYDGVHNRTSSAHQAGAWAYNQDNQLVQYPELKNSQALPTQVAYTPTGHTAGETNSRGTKTYRYNAAERLIEVSQTVQGGSTSNTTTTYRYDPFGRRISKTYTQGASTTTPSTTTYFVYNDTGLMAELNEQGQMTKAYGFNPQAAQAGLWSTDPLWQAEVSNNSLKDPATQTHYLHTDHLGTPMLATDKTGQTTWKGISEAFGLTRVDNSSSITMNLRFPGQYWDSETNTHYNFHRDYRPQVGRYVQSDPIGLGGGLNTYMYPENPLNLFDSKGLYRMSWSSRWTNDLFENKCITAFPGANCAFIRPTVLAVAVMDRMNISAPCEKESSCNENTDWRLSEYSVNVIFGVHLRKNYDSLPCDRSWVIRAEMDHISDYDAWAKGPAREIGVAIEKMQKGVGYSSRSECENTSAMILKNALLGSFAGVIRSTIASHDQSGRHFCGAPNARK